MDQIINKIASSGLITIDPADFLPKNPVMVFDLKPFLFRELILKEKDFREALKLHNWEQYRDKLVGICCSANAIIPMWAYMLVTSYLEPFTAEIQYGTEEDVLGQMAAAAIESMDTNQYTGQRIVIKGCGEKPVPTTAYITLMKKLRPVVKSIMFGEPCSTVPVYKQKKQASYE